MTRTAADTHSESPLSTVNGTLGTLTAIGILTMALAPLALPFLILTVAFLAPFGLLLVPLLPFAIVALVRRRRRRRAYSASPVAARASARSRIVSRRMTLSPRNVHTWK
jgi:hypothetical protein